MAGPSRIDQTPVRLNTKVTEDRQTPKTDFGTRMKDGMLGAASVVGSGVAAAGSMVPGGAILSAAVTGVDGMAGASSGAGRAGVASPSGAYGVGGAGAPSGGSTPAGIPAAGSQQFQEGSSLLQMQQASNMQFLTLQNNMQQENQKFSTLSNVMKVRHDTAKNSIQNIH